MRFVGQILGVGLSLWVTDYLFKGIEINGMKTLLIAAIILILMNTIVKPILALFALPITLLTLGLFMIVVNALTYWWAATLVDGFYIDSFMTAVWASLVTSIISTVVLESK